MFFFTVDPGDHAILVLLDLSAAFYTIDHAILMSRLEYCGGIKGNALKWINSFLSNRSFSACLGEVSSAAALLMFGVPHGSILAPILFPSFVLCYASVRHHF